MTVISVRKREVGRSLVSTHDKTRGRSCSYFFLPNLEHTDDWQCLTVAPSKVDYQCLARINVAFQIILHQLPLNFQHAKLSDDVTC